MPGPWRSCACAAGSRLPAGSRERSGRCRLLRSRPELLRGILEQATQRSAYSMQEMTRCGFVTLPGGHRLGICGTAVVQNGTITALREPSSLNLRIAASRTALPTALRDALWARPQSVLLVRRAGQRQDDAAARPHPGSSPTGSAGASALWTSGWSWRPVPPACRNSALARTRTCCPVHRRRRGIELLLRTMNPEWIAVDEITAEADIAAIRRASYCGVRFLATAHAADRRELESRPLYRTLLQDGFFRMAAFLLPDRSVRIERGLDHA